MAFAYSIKDEKGIYFVTFTVHQWIDVFTRQDYVNIFLDSISFCQKEKGLLVYAWVVMTNHVHLILRSEKEPLSEIIRDIKKFTATQIVKAIEMNQKESRKKWLLWLLKKEGKITFWQAGYHGEEIVSQKFMQTKLDYIHNNPVRASWVAEATEYINSSAKDILKNEKGKLELYAF
jgi:REP element-mobilizing transposase RayT